MSGSKGFHGKKVSTAAKRWRHFENDRNLPRKICIYCEREFKYAPNGNFCSRKCMAKFREEDTSSKQETNKDGG